MLPSTTLLPHQLARGRTGRSLCTFITALQSRVALFHHFSPQGSTETMHPVQLSLSQFLLQSLSRTHVRLPRVELRQPEL
jgi:hypothetical protein